MDPTGGRSGYPNGIKGITGRAGQRTGNSGLKSSKFKVQEEGLHGLFMIYG